MTAAEELGGQITRAIGLLRRAGVRVIKAGRTRWLVGSDLVEREEMIAIAEAVS